MSSFSPNNSAVVRQLSLHFAEKLSEFGRDVAETSFDPLLEASWAVKPDEEEVVWKAVADAIEAGPSEAEEIDKIKSSYLAEARTDDQKITLQKFRELEFVLFSIQMALADALKNADDIGSANKISAYEQILKCQLAAFQIGTLFAPQLARSRIYRWGNVVFLDFNRATMEHEPESAEAIGRVVFALANSVSDKASADLGVPKLSRVFRAFSQSRVGFDFLDVLNFGNVISSKGSEWDLTARQIIERAPPTSHYLWMLSRILINDVKGSVLRTSDVGKIKKLVAVIQAKRGAYKMVPKPGEVKQVLEKMEKSPYYRNIFGRDKKR